MVSFSQVLILFLILIIKKIVTSLTFHYPKLQNTRFVLLPGFGNDLVDYISPQGQSEVSISANFAKRGLTMDIVPIRRYMWLRILQALIKREFFSFTCRPDDLFSWYLDACDETIKKSGGKSPNGKVILVGHSAGGWLGRALLAERNYTSNSVSGLITLGTPHYPPIDLRKDVTRGCLDHVSKNYDANYLISKDYFVMTVGSSCVEAIADAESGTREKFACTSYDAVIGGTPPEDTLVQGDGVVPLSFMHLENSKQITFDDCFHSIDAPNDWYGGENIVDRWLKEAEMLVDSNSNTNVNTKVE